MKALKSTHLLFLRFIQQLSQNEPGQEVLKQKVLTYFSEFSHEHKTELGMDLKIVGINYIIINLVDSSLISSRREKSIPSPSHISLTPQGIKYLNLFSKYYCKVGTNHSEKLDITKI